MKKLLPICFTISLILSMAFNTAYAAQKKYNSTVVKKKSSTSGKSDYRSQNSSNFNTAQCRLGRRCINGYIHDNNQLQTTKSYRTDIAGMEPDRYDCEMGKSFTLYRNPGDEDHVILDLNGKRLAMHRTLSKIGAERFETDSKVTFIGVANLTQLIDFKQRRPILNECLNEQQKIFVRNQQKSNKGTWY